MTVFLCTCGTSAAKNQTDPRFNVAWIDDQGGIEAASRKLYDGFKHHSITDEAALSRYLSAEIHSLVRLGVKSSDRIVLFSSETKDGQACANAVKLYLDSQFPGVDCVVQIVPGLQVKDSKKFRTEGVINFMKKVLHEIDGYGNSQCVLNPTGGFKSLVPYTVLIGMIKGVAAKYIFEQSSELLDLPSLPIEFARERLEPLQSLIERINNETSVKRIEWEKAIPYHDRVNFSSIFEHDNDDVTLSSVGFLVWNEIQKPRALMPFISRKATDEMVKLTQLATCKPMEFIRRVSADKQQLENARHEQWSNGFFWLKPGAHTRDRYLCSIAGWRLLVWRMTDHDEYQELLDKNHASDQANSIIRDRIHYEPFFRMELYSI